MTTQEKIKDLIKARNLGDNTAQAKIDALFEQHRRETTEDRLNDDSCLSKSNALISGLQG